MINAINFYPRSRNWALREILILPSRNTICYHFGKHRLSEGTIESERTINNGISKIFTPPSNPINHE